MFNDFYRNVRLRLTDFGLLLQLIYSGYSCGQGWFFTTCSSDPSLRLDILMESFVSV